MRFEDFPSRIHLSRDDASLQQPPPARPHPLPGRGWPRHRVGWGEDH